MGMLMGGELAGAGVFAGADAVFHAGVHPVGGVDIGQLAAPAGAALGELPGLARQPPFGL
jgi:hypothetical protein